MKASVLITLLTSASASLCCIVPVLGMIGGSSSIVSSISWLEPLRPFFVASTIGSLGFAWYRAMKPVSKDECGCETEKRPFIQSKWFLGGVTAVSIVLLSFPTYSSILFKDKNVSIVSPDQEKNKKITLSVNGMTCSSCEHHIESEVIKLSGVTYVKASYASNSATVEYNPDDVSEDKIIASINSTGYAVVQKATLAQEKSKGNCCTKGSCTAPTVNVPNEKSKTLQILTSVDQIKDAFNKQPDKVKFVGILSSTCGWCLQGAEAIQKSVIEKMTDKNISVIIVWTNMLKTDDKDNAFKAASMFKDPTIVQYFDTENKFGDLVAKSLNPKGEKAWDIYMFYDKETAWQKTVPRPFDYAHQLSPAHEWVDNTKYFCGEKLTKRLSDITNSL